MLLTKTDERRVRDVCEAEGIEDPDDIARVLRTLATVPPHMMDVEVAVQPPPTLRCFEPRKLTTTLIRFRRALGAASSPVWIVQEVRP